ncbi:hypothetical protein FCV25MIE_07465 [Fagus crenata]
MTVLARLTGGKTEDKEDLAMSEDDIMLPLANIDRTHHIPTNNIEVGLLVSSIKRKGVEQKEDQSISEAKKAKVEGNMGNHLISPNLVEQKTPPTMVKVLSLSKTAAKGASPKSLARAKAGNTWRRTKKNFPQMSADLVAVLSATSESSPSSVQTAEEAGLITPHPSP